MVCSCCVFFFGKENQRTPQENEFGIVSDRRAFRKRGGLHLVVHLTSLLHFGFGWICLAKRVCTAACASQFVVFVQLCPSCWSVLVGLWPPPLMV